MVWSECVTAGSAGHGCLLEQIPWHHSSLFAAAMAVWQCLSSPYGPVSSQEWDPRLGATPFQICVVFSNTLNSPLSSHSEVWTSCPTCRTNTRHQHHHHDAGLTPFAPLPSLPYAWRSCPTAPGRWENAAIRVGWCGYPSADGWYSYLSRLMRLSESIDTVIWVGWFVHPSRLVRLVVSKHCLAVWSKSDTWLPQQ